MTHEEYTNTEILEKGDTIGKGKANHSEDLEDEVVGDKDNNDGLKEEDKSSEVLLSQHEVVPLEDPGPNIANEDGVVGDNEGLKEEDKISEVLLNQHEVVPLEDPGPSIANEDGVRGVAGATQ